MLAGAWRSWVLEINWNRLATLSLSPGAISVQWAECVLSIAEIGT